jgi:hypothetical protein
MREPRNAATLLLAEQLEQTGPETFLTTLATIPPSGLFAQELPDFPTSLREVQDTLLRKPYPKCCVVPQPQIFLPLQPLVRFGIFRA